MTHEDYMQQWTLYDSNVQTYRANFIASQSLLLAVGALFFGKSFGMEVLIFCIALFQMWYIWIPIIHSRTTISDFYKFNALYNLSMLVDDNGDLATPGCVPLREHTYRKNDAVRVKANRAIAEITGNRKLQHNNRNTRIRLDHMLPLSFSLIWVAIIAASCYIQFWVK